MSAATMIAGIAYAWTTVRNVSVLKVLPIRWCAAGSVPPSSRWTLACPPPCFLYILANSGGAGSAEGCLPLPGTMRFTVPLVPQTGPNGASERGHGKSGLMCRKSTL